MELVPTLLVAAGAVIIVWKFLKGAFKTLALLSILLAAALFVLGGLS
ncbi:hypothetical protein RM533_04860 [Croceicoccus sp. F390]|uniref:Uncharacterized protein n=1 Tax=Croceicoccus esteveae TaxID=3075597 RepID=A0ABU2ZHH3_9SPHN|nr:hypothetical protein [Croceicoccus sp. F390]MDT0575508.1 hypothetical protein [Croceicoccus sp. F390]